MKTNDKYTFALSFILPIEVVLFTVISSFLKYRSLINDQISKKKNLIFYLIILLIFSRRTFIDTSKGAILELLTQFLSVFLVVNKSFFIRLKYLYFMLIAALSSVPIYFLAYGLHLYKFLAASSDMTMSQYILKRFSFADLLSYTTATIGGEESLMGLVDNLSRRVSYFDYLNVFFHGEVINQYMSLQYTLKVIFNSIFPGFLGLNIPEAEILPSRLFKVAYGYENFIDNLFNYHTDHLPLYGFLYTNFSLSALLVIFLTGGAIAIIYRFLSSLNIGNIHIFQSIFIYFSGLFLFGIGIAESIQDLLYNYTLAIPAVYFMYYLFRKFKFKITN